MTGRATEAVDLGVRDDDVRLRYWQDRAISLSATARCACPSEWETVAAAHLAEELRECFRAEMFALEVDEIWRALISAAIEEVDWLAVATGFITPLF